MKIMNNSINSLLRPARLNNLRINKIIKPLNVPVVLITVTEINDQKITPTTIIVPKRIITYQSQHSLTIQID